MSVRGFFALAIRKAHTPARWTTVLIALFLLACSPMVDSSQAVFAPKPPPETRVEDVPHRPSPRHAWIPGHWAWHAKGDRFVWKPGRYDRIPHTHQRHWIAGSWHSTREGYVWVAGRWR